MKAAPAEVCSTSESRKFLSKATSGASSDPKVAVAIKHCDVGFVVLDDEEVDDAVVVWEAEETVVVDDDDVEVEVAWVTTVNCVWFSTVTFPLLAETYVMYCP